MILLSALVSLLSLATSMVLHHEPPNGQLVYDSSNYHMECGMQTVLNITDCEKLYPEIRKLGAPSNGWWTKTDWAVTEWEHESCKATLVIKILPKGGLKIHTSHLINTGHFGLKTLCGETSQRALVKPQNGTWELYFTEPSWNISRPFTRQDSWNAYAL
ncbi:hypothetical protein FZEAL_8172 [Fusarium zealandicum]|uniref:Uncharacterized protein n=1 Tax=Fusarium zealandicum TaxID=1053134 RepID=A0A8H4XH32_9HYPO|nr:hypothetical protein FZEAL_8172 [Fusarium zealandicum]